MQHNVLPQRDIYTYVSMLFLLKGECQHNVMVMIFMAADINGGLVRFAEHEEKSMSLICGLSNFL
ncbi:hypothetical protein NFHSH190041_15930 [Shewanella sp. NFH-SH190041]|uniref:hypothetical protein n=1 Tax=Shewanella sp. NFH-SH190041 TaxID=2950245 RepID=UPI0021C30BFC|nr:hypothetical protein [Shewanella sp. NFH-SH190041]BDM64141.1 hypothetical protein NFHSH190041_15930 [Shewanella sp. NFH-SH190041]